MVRKKRNRRITEGGLLGKSMNTVTTRDTGFRYTEPDIILQMPELFMFDMRAYMNSLDAAKSIDFYSRVRLYDMYESALLDLHLSGIIDKRRIGVSRIPIEFRRDGKPDEQINAQIRSPWFRTFVKDVLMSKFWGFSAFQFDRNEKGWIEYYKIPYKHYDPVRRILLHMQSDQDGVPIEDFPNTLVVCDDPRGLGMLAELVPMVLYKRGNFGDWAKFCQIFGMPIREYTYDAGDEEARKRLIMDARSQGGNAVYIHPKESSLNLIESSNKSGTVDLYERLKDACNTEMSVRVLGNTLTTDAKSTGTQALGTVHQEEEDALKQDDRDFVLDILNYEMTDIFANLGINTEGGEFVYVENLKLDPNKHVDVIQKAKAMGLPIDDDYLYKVLKIEKPENYEQLKAEIQAQEEANRQLQQQMANAMGTPKTKEEMELRNRMISFLNKNLTLDNSNELDNARLTGFFGLAPNGNGALEF